MYSLGMEPPTILFSKTIPLRDGCRSRSEESQRRGLGREVQRRRTSAVGCGAPQPEWLLGSSVLGRSAPNDNRSEIGRVHPAFSHAGHISTARGLRVSHNPRCGLPGDREHRPEGGHVDRKTFLRTVCGLGVCGCVASLDPPEALAAAPRQAPDQRLAFARYQVAKMAGFMAVGTTAPCRAPASSRCTRPTSSSRTPVGREST